ncbi:MAG: polyphosphate polymerase domain-containing protein [Dehalococcoidales bacterium]|jgi:hypothetical protein
MPPEETEIKIASILNKITGQPPATPAQRFERKYAVPPADSGLALALIRQVCRPDKEYPRDLVHSLYFDTPDLDQYRRSESGEFRKDKVRIRWYNESPGGTGEVPVYLELKSRQGFASSKQRCKFTVSAALLRPENLRRGILEKTRLLQTLAGFGCFPEQPLQPVILISYLRCRFNEMQTGERVSFDRDIRAAIVNPELGRGEKAIRLPNAVIEVKGPSLALPPTLRRLKILDVDWSRFSKYGNCLDIFFADPGSVARLWPPGKLVLP